MQLVVSQNMLFKLKTKLGFVQVLKLFYQIIFNVRSSYNNVYSALLFVCDLRALETST
jgi:hypothetical protein